MDDFADREYISIGCGKVKYDNCVHMDIADNKFTDVDIVGDVRSIPFPEKRFKGAIFAHVLEHLDKRDHRRALFEIRRVLQDDGQVYIEVPDMLKACTFFVENFKGRRDYWYQCLYGRNDYSSDSHKSGITEQYLTDILFDCGFGKLKWLNLEKDEALIGVFATKLDEVPKGRL